jgi:hypothetical protein
LVAAAHWWQQPIGGSGISSITHTCNHLTLPPPLHEWPRCWC